MGHLKPLHATYTQEDVITARRKTTETPKRLASQNYYRTIDGIVTGTHANGTYDVTVPGRPHPYTEVHCIIPRLKLEIHQGCTLGFMSNSPNLPMIIAVKFVGKRKAAAVPDQITLGLWQQAEANPLNDRGPKEAQASPEWTGSPSTVFAVPRFYYSAALQNDFPANLPNRLSTEGVVLGTETVACLVSLYSADESEIVGYLLREYNTTTTTVTDWLHILGTAIVAEPTNGLNRRHGHLFYDQAAGNYTIACSAGLLLCTTANAPTPTVCAWAHTYGSIPPESSVNVSGAYAIQGAHAEYADSGTRADCSIDLYSRGETEWAHVAQVSLADQLTDCAYVRPCGNWDPYTGDETATSENTRWPYLPSQAEWVAFVAGRDNVNPLDRPTIAKAKIIGIKAATGVVRTIHAWDAPLELLHPYAELMDQLAAQLTYQSSHHVADWRDRGFPLGPVDDQNANGWSTGEIYSYGEFGGIPEDDLPENLGRGEPGDPIAYTQKVLRYTGMTTSRNPTVAPDCQRLECAASLSPLTMFPMGIVDQVANRIYIANQEDSWLAGETPDVGGIDEGNYSYLGNYTDFAVGEYPDAPDFWVRVFSYEQDVQGSAGYGTDSLIQRLILRQLSPTRQIRSLDLTRSFAETVGAKNYTHRRKPDLFTYLKAGDYLWLLANDWWDKDTQHLTLILVATATLTQTDRIKLEPITGLTWLDTAGRPQMVRGIDSSEAPWVNVAAWWTTPNEFFLQKVTVSGTTLAKTTLAHDTAAGDQLPATMTEFANVAIRNGSQYWLDAGLNVRKLIS